MRALSLEERVGRFEKSVSDDDECSFSWSSSIFENTSVDIVSAIISIDKMGTDMRSGWVVGLQSNNIN